MSTESNDSLPIHEAGDTTSDRAVEIFDAWKGLDWTKASVDRFEGLTLIADGDAAIKLHFVSALCGYAGSGPRATAMILHLAGFGDLDVILRRVSDDSNQRDFFFK